MFLLRKWHCQKPNITSLSRVEAMGIYAYCVDHYEKFGDLKYQAISILNKFHELSQLEKDSWSRHGQMLPTYLEIASGQSVLVIK